MVRWGRCCPALCSGKQVSTFCRMQMLQSSGKTSSRWNEAEGKWANSASWVVAAQGCKSSSWKFTTGLMVGDLHVSAKSRGASRVAV